MAGFSNYLEAKLLNQVFGGTAYVAPATLWLGLSVGDPTDTGSLAGEPVGNAYERVAITNNTTNFPNVTAGSKASGATFTLPRALGSWGTITHFFYSDAQTAGNMLGSGLLSEAKAITTGDTPNFLSGSLTITLD